MNQIAAAISAHALWKARLRQSVLNGHVDSTVLSPTADRTCDFGKWLQSTAFTATGAESVHYANVKEKHLTFHKAASRVVRVTIAGDADEAARMLEFGGEYSTASAQLTAALLEWKVFLSARVESTPARDMLIGANVA